MGSSAMVLDVETEAFPLSEATHKLIRYAYEEAQHYGDDFVSTEHLLLGVLRSEDSGLCHLLNDRPVSIENARSIVARNRVGRCMPDAEISLTPRAKRVLNLARDEAQSLRSDNVKLEHILLGLLREDEGLAAVILKKQGLQLEELRVKAQSLQSATV